MRFQARVVGDPSAGIQEVWVTYTGERGSPLHGAWTSLNLTQDPNDSTLWTGSFTLPDKQDPAAIRYVVQAANGVGVVGLDDNQGFYFTPGITAGTVDPRRSRRPCQSAPESRPMAPTVRIFRCPPP